MVFEVAKLLKKSEIGCIFISFLYIFIENAGKICFFCVKNWKFEKLLLSLQRKTEIGTHFSLHGIEITHY